MKLNILDALGKNARTIIGLIITLGGFGYLFALLYKMIPTGNETVLNVASGLVLGVMSQVCAYYFGSSKDKSDQEKADIQEKMATATTVTEIKKEDKPTPE